MTEVSSLLRERPIGPVDNAVWWVEQIIKHPQIAEYLLPFGSEQTWYQRRELDVWGFLIIILCVVLWLTKKIVLRFYRCYNARKDTSQSIKKNK